MARRKSGARIGLAALAALGLAACSEGGGGTTPTGGGGGGGAVPQSGAFETVGSTARFLTQSTFGPTEDDLSVLAGTSAEDWFLAELQKPVTLHLPFVEQRLAEPGAIGGDGLFTFGYRYAPQQAFWRNAVSADDQLRQRMTFALSQIFVISNSSGRLEFFPQTVAAYQDVLARNALGNFRDLLEEVTYSPAMGEFLTYLQNQKGDPATGRMPDENYAREVMQLFTIGLVMLQPNGEPQLDGTGQPIETYTNEDVTGLARVFTGLSYDAPDFFFSFNNLNPGALTGPMIAFPAFHSDLEKSFPRSRSSERRSPPGRGRPNRSTSPSTPCSSIRTSRPSSVAS